MLHLERTNCFSINSDILKKNNKRAINLGNDHNLAEQDAHVAQNAHKGPVINN
jgi:hypothetical protein